MNLFFWDSKRLMWKFNKESVKMKALQIYVAARQDGAMSTAHRSGVIWDPGRKRDVACVACCRDPNVLLSIMSRVCCSRPLYNFIWVRMFSYTVEMKARDVVMRAHVKVSYCSYSWREHFECTHYVYRRNISYMMLIPRSEVFLEKLIVVELQEYLYIL
jgi:hypothetical protein